LPVERLRRVAPFALVLSILGVLGSPAAGAVDWRRYADEKVIEVVTRNEDGSSRETKAWIVVVDGQGYIRTGSTRWGANALRNPDVTLIIGESQLPLRVEFVDDDEIRQKVADSFRAKYGWADRLMSPFRGSHPKIMRLVPRESGS
jgi:hypothetical protein